MNNYWLLLEKSDETRIYNSIDSYNDSTGEIYNYDSLVQNCKNLKKDDLAFIRKENSIIGYGQIGHISSEIGMKPLRKCPECSTTAIAERKTRIPKWRCSRCRSTFEEPIEDTKQVELYSASFKSFNLMVDAPTVEAIKNCSISPGGTKSQVSMMRLNKDKVVKLLGDFDSNEKRKNKRLNASAGSGNGQGFGLSYEERKAVELFAMKEAISIFEERGWKVYDKSNTKPYDLLAMKGHQKKFIEVKGTKGEGESIILTHGEVNHAKAHSKESVLIIIGRIKTEKKQGNWVGVDGELILIEEPWMINDYNLKATQFRYNVF